MALISHDTVSFFLFFIITIFFFCRFSSSLPNVAAGASASLVLSSPSLISSSTRHQREKSTGNNHAGGSAASICQQLDPSPTLPQFVDALSSPPVIHVSTGQQLTIGAYKIKQKLHRDLPPTTLYAFGTSQEEATYPGPTLVAKEKVPTEIRWENHIQDTQHMFQVDSSIHWAAPIGGGVPVVPHLHGAEVQSYYDGHPEAWFTHTNETGPTFYIQNYTYVNDQSPAGLWYHDHTLGITRLNVVSGLAGMYIIRSQLEEAYNITMGIPLIIQDKQFYEDGSINFPTVGILPKVHAHWCPEYYGDTIVVNGKVWPYLEVQPAAYRFRILNACSARFLVLSLNGGELPIYQIGTDGGVVTDDGPYWNLTSVTLAPAERADVVIDFSGLPAGSHVVLNNSGPTPYPSGDISIMPPGTYAAMRFVVVVTKASQALNSGGEGEGGAEDGVVEGGVASLEELPALIAGAEAAAEVVPREEDAAVRRLLGVVEYDDDDYMPLTFMLENRTWEEPAVDLPEEGVTEVWELMNLRINAHPVHVHLASFRVLNQQTFSNRNWEAGACSLHLPYPDNGTCFTEAPRPPFPYQRGWKDTAIIWPSVVTRVLVRFSRRDGSPFSFDPSQGPGYIWHCHIVDHEDNVMMRPFKVIRNTSNSSSSQSPYDLSSSSSSHPSLMKRMLRGSPY